MSWLAENFQAVWQLVLWHVALSVPPIVLGFVLSIPFGWLANRYRLSRGVLLSIGGVLYAIPSLPLLAAMPSLIGTRILDPVNLVVALSIYALALMVRASADALAAVPGEVKQSATAVGFSGWKRFWAVELPLAGPILLAGVRVVSVSTVSLVSIGSLVGVPSLGNLFLDGYQRNFPTEIVIGIIGSVAIALLFDLALVIAGRLLLPWNVRRRVRRNRVPAVAGEPVA